MEEIAEQILSDLGAFHAMTGLGSRSQEPAICRHVAASFFRRGTPSFACIAYPESARIGDGVTRDECDLVVRVAANSWLWVEAKQIWKPGAGHWLWVDAVNDVAKLSTLRHPEASYAAILLIGLDKSVREPSYLHHDIEGRFAEAAGLRDWQHVPRPYEPRDGRRVAAWLWWRSLTGADRPNLLHRR